MIHDVHTTDAIAWRRCRRAAHWGGRWSMGLRPVHPSRPLFLGSAVHAAMNVLYSQDGDIVKAQLAADTYFMEGWKEYQQNGGYMSEEVERDWDDDRALVWGMLRNYVDWAQTVDDDWEVIDTEREFRLPLFNYLMTDGIGYDLVGRIDGVSMHRPSQTLWLREYKTAKSIPDEQKRIEKDLQARAYCWAASQIYQRPIVGIEYRFLRKAVPDEPRVLQNGKLSVNKMSNVTLESFMKAAGGEVGPYAEYIAWLRDQPNSFFLQYKLNKSEREQVSGAMTILEYAREMFNPDSAATADPDWYKCNYCAFRNPCDKLDAGYDVSAILRNEYVQADAPVLSAPTEDFSAEF